VGARPNHVVTARAHADEVGTQLERRLNLFLRDLANQFSAHREIRVREVFIECRESFSKPVCPAAQSARAIGVRVADTFCEGITNRHEPRPGEFHAYWGGRIGCVLLNQWPTSVFLLRAMLSAHFEYAS